MGAHAPVSHSWRRHRLTPLQTRMSRLLPVIPVSACVYACYNSRWRTVKRFQNYQAMR